MELTRTQLLSAIDNARAANDMEAVARIMKVLPNPAEAQAGSIDRSTGAGLGTRAIVGNAKNPADRLASMRNHYPEAQPYGEDNFAFYNRDDGRPTLYNPPGMMPELGDFAEYGRVGAEIAAGVGAGIMAAPSTPVGQVAAAGTAATAAGALYDQAINQLGGEDSRDLGKLASDTAIEFGVNMIPFDKGLGAAKDFISPKLRSVMTNANKAVIDVANKYDINATAGVLGNRFMQGVDAATQKVLGGVDAWEKSAADMMEGVGRMIDDFHFSLGGKSNPEAAGQQLVNQAKKYADNFQTTSEELYEQVDKFIPENARVPALKTRDFLAAYRDRFANDPEISKIFRDPKIGALADVTADMDYARQNMDYTTIRSLRTMIGGKIKDRDTIGDLSQGDLKQLYAALTDDLFAGAADFGEEAFKAMTDANDFYRAGSVIMEDVVEKHFMTTGKWSTASEAFSSIKKVVNDPEKLRSMQASGVLEEGDFNQVGSALLDDLGAATKGGQNAAADRISPSRIIAQTDNSVIPLGSQDILLTGNAKEIMADMRVFGEAVQGVDGLVNRSNTGAAVQFGGLGLAAGSLSADPIAGLATMVGSLALPYLTSKGMASQWLKDWMRNAPKEGGKKAIAQWKKDGARLAAAQSATPFFQAILDMSNNNTDSGALEE
tara:strand:+ start:1082 stop:3067 length:1986 start_codon:yes stop_codon:yes gene_type:complete